MVSQNSFSSLITCTFPSCHHAQERVLIDFSLYNTLNSVVEVPYRVAVSGSESPDLPSPSRPTYLSCNLEIIET